MDKEKLINLLEAMKIENQEIVENGEVSEKVRYECRGEINVLSFVIDILRNEEIFNYTFNNYFKTEETK